MQQPASFYKIQLKSHKTTLSTLKKKLNLSSSVRLLLFIGIGVMVYFTFNTPKLAGVIAIAGIAFFLFLVTRHAKLKLQRDLTKALIAINTKELQALEGIYQNFPDGNQFYNPEHFYSQDIDLFGRGSFYQYANRTALESGAQVFADTLLANDIDHIPEKQEAIKELSNLPEWRQRFSAIASLVKTEIPAGDVVSWLDNYKPFTPKHIKTIARIFGILSVLICALYGFSIISGYWVFVIFGLGLFISARFMGKVSMLHNKASEVQTTFQQYAQLLFEIEEQEFLSSTLSRKRKKIISTDRSSSGILKKFSRYLDALDQRNNVLVAVFVNGFFLRDLIIASNIEQWIKTYGQDAEVWFETIAFFDGYNSLGNYAFNHPEHTYPEITDSKTTIHATEAVHPLLKATTAVPNDIAINRNEFFIITGANMAGKSTFLRTVALQIVMANAGLPVRATATTYTPIKLITSMRTTDSLTDDESYFFSELKRLKFIVDAIKEDEYFIILDEILKGTNSTDKATGSRKFVDKLVQGGATGIIATHDLSLCEASETLPEVTNYYFDAQIIDDELFFDYTFKKGICQNMNASFLLKKMEIVD
ncbi:DNA mismatch repair protein MutS [Dokdonia sinensis]|uniref:DNA mismatch repair protein MutS n=2 Tax=Dokdonia sinensis TaxID=2479847 RepID=A0A3M0GCE8_9FLAO|nr:DNA mismatch repair protein MutS [Dokdonia sinensis]